MTIQASPRHLVAALLAIALVVPALPAMAEDSAAILMYHRFGESSHPSTNIRLAQFEAHIETLTSGGYTVLPVPEIVAAIREGRDLPERTVGITIDDGYLSIYSEAWPRLQAADLPFTVFLSTDPVDRGFAGFMSWDQIAEMKQAGVTFGGHTASHLHMPANDLARNREDIERSHERYRAMLGEAPKLFAFPFGEASTEVMNLVREMGYEAAFGQHSGVLDSSSDPLYMPRFALNESFGDLERFRLVANALPIPFADLTPADPTLQENPPRFGFSLAPGAEEIDDIACYAGDQGKLKVERIGPRVEVRLREAFGAGRARINCTAPAEAGRWRWLGMLYYVPRS